MTPWFIISLDEYKDGLYPSNERIQFTEPDSSDEWLKKGCYFVYHVVNIVHTCVHTEHVCTITHPVADDKAVVEDEEALSDHQKKDWGDDAS